MVRVVSLFSGGGFAEEALRLASLRSGIPAEVVMAVDNWEPAARVRDANLDGVRTTRTSVKELNREGLPPHDLVIGGPPCQGWSLAGKRLGAADPRDCVPDFVRLRGNCWLMENVVPRLLDEYGTGWSEKFSAADFGDVTSRKRWFYASHILNVVPTPGPRRIRDIRDQSEPRLKLALRGNSKAANATVFEDDGVLGSILANAYHANRTREHSATRNPSLLEMARAHSISDSWDWAGATKAQRGQMIANGWPIGMGAAVCEAMLRAITHQSSQKKPPYGRLCRLIRRP